MTRKKIKNRELVLNNKVGVRFDNKTYMILNELVQKTNSHSVGELVRRIIEKDKIRFYAIDGTMDAPLIELCKIREELNAIGRNINQITHFFHIADEISQKLFYAVNAKDQYNKVQVEVEKLLSYMSVLGKKWLSPETHQKTKIEIKLENFEYKYRRKLANEHD